jgi:ActR/RegA family two-component response regulator
MARLLILDDEELVCRALQRVLKGHDVDIASSSAEGIALHVARPYSLAFVDVHLRDTNGVETAALLMHVCPLRVVLMTGDVFDRLEIPAHLEVLRKPFTIAEIEECVLRLG